MRILRIAGAVAATIMLLVVVSGAVAAPGHVATVKATLARPPADVWQRITDHAGQPRWRSELKALVVLPPRDGKFAFEEENDFDRVQYVVDEVVVLQRYVVRITSEGLGYTGRWIFELSAAPTAPASGPPAATDLVITEEGEVQSFLFRALSPLFSKTATIKGYFAALAAELGVGATPEVVRAK